MSAAEQNDFEAQEIPEEQLGDVAGGVDTVPRPKPEPIRNPPRVP